MKEEIIEMVVKEYNLTTFDNYSMESLKNFGRACIDKAITKAREERDKEILNLMDNISSDGCSSNYDDKWFELSKKLKRGKEE